MMEDAGVPVHTIQLLIGHSRKQTMGTTAIYTKGEPAKGDQHASVCPACDALNRSGKYQAGAARRERINAAHGGGNMK